MYIIRILYGINLWLKRHDSGKLEWIDKKSEATRYTDYESAWRDGIKGLEILTQAGFSVEAEVTKVQDV